MATPRFTLTGFAYPVGPATLPSFTLTSFQWAEVVAAETAPARRYVVPGTYRAAATIPGAYRAGRTLPTADLSGGS